MIEFLPLWVCIIALILDALLGEPKYHPLVIFGNCAMFMEKKFNNGESKFGGIFSVIVLVFCPAMVLWFLLFRIDNPFFELIMGSIILWIAIGWKSMKDHARAVAVPLSTGDVEGARRPLSMIVSRDTAVMDEEMIVGSTLESILENGHDCLFASLFWYAVLGPAGVVLHRLSNTLDAMWGYRTERYRQFGFAAARLDDCLGWIPARLTGLCYALSGSFVNAVKSWGAQAGKHKSINGGLVMASGAGALGIRIGGPVIYHGVLENKPFLGVGRAVESSDIQRSISLIHRSVAVWIVGYALVIYLISLIR